jgi:cob(I)alamin adenosyltransferase
MASISTRRGDGGTTGLPDGSRVSKGELRVEASGTVDELKTFIGLARSLCNDLEIKAFARTIQKELFAIGSAISTKPGGPREIPTIGKEMIERLDAAVAKMEAEPNLVRDWTVSGDHQAAAAFDVARTVARRAERNTVRLVTSGEKIQPTVLAYLNRLSDVMWLCARVLEVRAGIDSRIRDAAHPGPPWSRAW